MKLKFIVTVPGHALLWCLAKLWPIEDIIGEAVKQAAKSKVAREVASTVAALERGFLAEMHAAHVEHDRLVAAHKARLAALDSVPHLVTPEGAASLVAAAADSATVNPQGQLPAPTPALATAA